MVALTRRAVRRRRDVHIVVLGGDLLVQLVYELLDREPGAAGVAAGSIVTLVLEFLAARGAGGDYPSPLPSAD